MEPADLDPTDERLLYLLNDNARTPSETLAKELGISVEDVDRRIERLKDEGVITKFTSILDASKLGYISVAFGFSVEPGKADDIAKQLARYDNVYKLWILSGRHNIIAHANFNDITEFQAFSSDTLHNVNGIANYETSIVTKSVINEGDVILTDD